MTAAADDRWACDGGEQEGFTVAPPHDIQAERFTLAAMMTAPWAVEQAAETLTGQSFYRPAHQVLFEAMIAMWAHGQPIDAVSLRTWIETEHGDGAMKALGGPTDGPLYIFGLMQLQAMIIASNVRTYAAVVQDKATRRAVLEMHMRGLADARRPGWEPAAGLAAARRQLDAAVAGALSADDRPGLMFPDEVCDAEWPSAEELVRGLLNRQDRVVVVGPGGAGKSMLALQAGFAAAAGGHPFIWHRRDDRPLRVLVMDCENPGGIIRKRFTWLRGIAATYPLWDQRNLALWHRPGGISVMNPRDAYDARVMCREHRPDLLIAGPAYKMIKGVPRDGKADAYSRLSDLFDDFRDEFGCAIWLEVHAPWGAGRTREMRPEDTNLWEKWPEFRIALNWATKTHGGQEGLDIEHYAGQRDEERYWPEWITRNHGPGWPWTPNGGRLKLLDPLAGTGAA